MIIITFNLLENCEYFYIFCNVDIIEYIRTLFLLIVTSITLSIVLANTQANELLIVW